MRIRRVATAPDDAAALTTWHWLGWLGSEFRTLDEVDVLIAASSGSVAPSISAHLTEAVIDWIGMGVIEIEELLAYAEVTG